MVIVMHMPNKENIETKTIEDIAKHFTKFAETLETDEIRRMAEELGYKLKEDVFLIDGRAVRDRTITDPVGHIMMVEYGDGDVVIYGKGEEYFTYRDDFKAFENLLKRSKRYGTNIHLSTDQGIIKIPISKIGEFAKETYDAISEEPLKPYTKEEAKDCAFI